jgi:hypothetical protein
LSVWLPHGCRPVARRRARFLNGRGVEIDVAEVDKQFVLDELFDGRRAARIDLPGFRAGGRIVTLELTPAEDSVDVYVEYVGPESARIVAHFLPADARGFDYIN